MIKLARVAALCLLAGSAMAAPDAYFDDELRALQQAWAHVNYEVPAGEARMKAFDQLEKRAEKFTHDHSDRAEALRRELADSNVRVQYLAPRATRTGMNAVAVERMNAELGVAMDPPELVARAACDMLEHGRREAVLGWPEKAFVRINALLPRIVDGSLRRQLEVIRRHARSAEAPNYGPFTGGESR